MTYITSEALIWPIDHVVNEALPTNHRRRASRLLLADRHRFTGGCKQIVAGQLMGQMAGLAICHQVSEDAFYLFGCDADWQSVTDTWHQTVEDAKHQAEFEYEDISTTWIDAA